MRKLRELVSKLGDSFHKQRKDWKLEAEVESHLQIHIEDNLRLGMTPEPEEARRQPVIRLGGVESTKEAYRYQHGLPLLDRMFLPEEEGWKPHCRCGVQFLPRPSRCTASDDPELGRAGKPPWHIAI